MGKKKKEKVKNKEESGTVEERKVETVHESGSVIKKQSSLKMPKSESKIEEQGTSKVLPEEERVKTLENRESVLKSITKVPKETERLTGSSKVLPIEQSKDKLKKSSSSKVVFKPDSEKHSPEDQNVPPEKEKVGKKAKKQKKGKKIPEEDAPTESTNKMEVDVEKPKKKGGKKQKKITMVIPSATEVPSVTKTSSVTKTPSEMKPTSKTLMSVTEQGSELFSSKTDMTAAGPRVQSQRTMTSSVILPRGGSSKLRTTSSQKLKRSSKKLASSRSLGLDESFEEYSSSTASSEEVVIKDKKEKKRPPKKEKKSKKKTREKSDLDVEEKPEEPVEKEYDVLEDIAKMKAESMQRAMSEVQEPAETVEEVVVEEPKKVPKKKVSKKERARMTAEMAEKLRIEAEQEAARLAELERIRLEQEKKEAIEKEKREIVEQQIREEQLEKSIQYIRDVTNLFMEHSKAEREQSEWQLYVDCRKLPDPSLCVQMNRYLHLWEKIIDGTTMKEAADRTNDVLQLLEELEDLIDNSIDEDEKKKGIWRWVRQLFREHQKESLDVATYRLLRCVEKNLNRIDIPTADFNYKNEDINLSIWLRVQLPIPLPNPRRPPKPRVDVSFPEIGMQVLLPITVDCENMALRAMYLKYDHLSDSCQTYHMTEAPPHYRLDLPESTRREWRIRQKYKYDHRDKKRKPGTPLLEHVDSSISERALAKKEEEKKEAAEEEPTEFASDEEIPVVPYKKLDPTSSEFAVSLEGKAYMDAKRSLMVKVHGNILNLRKYAILGGVFHLDLLFQPPQPQDFVTTDMTITCLYLPKKLEHVPFSVIYNPPVPPESGVKRLPEEIEEEMKKQEEEMDKLMMVTLTWPQHVIFLELPLVCQWDETKKHWTKENIHDLKHNEEKCTLTFRTGLFGIFGLAAVRYANLPYQAWEIRPEADESVTINITATILIIELNIKNGLICITQLQNSPNNALQDMIGIYFKIYKLKRIMKEAGVDVFPEPDAFCYVSGSCEKQWPMEKHLYNNMARLSNVFNFAWSRWNFPAGRRSIVLQMREYFPNKPKQKNHSMLLVTPLKSTYVDCTEVSQVFSDQGIENQKFSADLFNLMKATSGIAVRKKVQSVSKENVHALSELLIYMRILSLS
ncbi:dynein axonemal intermediate chain 7 isoform X1 [Leptinotarsa decemlineata]|uniref:dynein axonemal intermediate chain 7 isoform X1 n=1 Tax=Leptinotarsa decemlineata TaxID=7539 RepID=UPI003D3069F5